MMMNTDINNTVDLLLFAREKGLRVFVEEGKLKFTVADDTEVDKELVLLLRTRKQELLDFLIRSTHPRRLQFCIHSAQHWIG